MRSAVSMSAHLRVSLALYPRGDPGTTVGGPAQVDLLHDQVGLDLGHGPLAEDLALVQHGHPAGEAADEVHVVLDDHEGTGESDRPEQLTGAGTFLPGHACNRLVKQQEPRVL